MAEPNKRNEELDIFIANSIYPQAGAVFQFLSRSLESIKDEAYIVLDTNTLLIPYTTSKESLEQIRQTYKALINTKRLVIPGQVAREFAKNRANKLSDLYKQISDKKSKVTALRLGDYPLLSLYECYQESKKLEDQMNPLINAYQERLGQILDQIRKWNWDDPVSTLYSELFSSDVIVEPSDDPLDLKRELARRQLHKLPPGYKDSSKVDEGIGDLLIWYTILEIGRTHKKSVIFVSADEKADWWHQSNNQALYPRYELVDEFRRCSEGQSFQIIRFSRLLELYGASKQVIKEIEQGEILSIGSYDSYAEYLGPATLLWVDDKPLNNIIEKDRLEALGVQVKSSISTEEAVQSIRSTKYDVIISDMSRPPDAQAGYTLLKALQEIGNTTPVIIYATGPVVDLPENKIEAQRQGAFGCTSDYNELFQLITDAILRR